MLIPREMTINTLGFVKRLEASGFPRAHAEAYASVLLNGLAERNSFASAYETQGYVSQLRAAGVTRQQAEGWVNAMPLVMGDRRENPSADAKAAPHTAVEVSSPHADDDGFWFFMLCVAALLAISL